MSKPSTNHTKTSKHIVMIVSLIIAIVFLVAGILGYLVVNYLSKPTLTKEQKALVELARDIEIYPDAYIAAGLPQYPNGELTSLSKKSDTVSDDINVTINTNDALDTITKYYDEKLTALGWVATGVTSQISTDQYLKEYKKDNQTITVFVNPSSQQGYKNLISVTWSELD